MAASEEKVMEILEEVAKETNIKPDIRAVVYRGEDYQDYIVVIGSDSYSELRQKLIDDYINAKNQDTVNEIAFKLKHPAELEEWQKDELGLDDEMSAESSENVELDGEENDWI